MRSTRPISWLNAARREFETFPEEAQHTLLRALAIAAEGGKADIAKPFKGTGGGVFEIALKHRGDAYRTVYAVQIGDDLWVMRFKRSPRVGSRHHRWMWIASRNGSSG
jgi:phage-related protein